MAIIWYFDVANLAQRASQPLRCNHMGNNVFVAICGTYIVLGAASDLTTPSCAATCIKSFVSEAASDRPEASLRSACAAARQRRKHRRL